MNRPEKQSESANGRTLRMTALCALGVLALSVTVSTGVVAQTPAVDPEAVEILRRTTGWLGSLERFSVDAQNTWEDVADSGHRIDYEMFATALISRPNRLRTERHGDGIDQVFYYDGEVLTLYNPPDRVYGVEVAPGTIEEMFQFAYDSLGIGTPISDLVHRDVFPLLMQGVDLAVFVGKEMINGIRCDHLLFSRPDVDFQIWVADSGPPVPLKYMVTDTTTPELLSVAAVMSNWNLDPAVPDTAFTFVPPEGTQAVPFLRAESSGVPDPMAPDGGRQ
jgi:hypothetical protein